MSAALDATFDLLAKTENEAAVDVLIAGLDNPHRPTRHGALRTIMERRSPAGHREVFRRLATLDEDCRAIIRERGERLESVVSEAVRNPDRRACAAACDAVSSFRLYDALPALVSVLLDGANPNAPLVAQTALRLTELFYAELSGAREPPKRKGQENVRRRITTALEEAVRKFHRYKRREVVEALLLVVKHNNVILRQLLRRPGESSYQPIVELLSSSTRGGVIRLLLGFLEDPQMPQVVAKVLCQRCDPKFVDHLLRTIGPRPSKTVAETLKRIESIAWAQPGHALFEKLNDQAQEGAVQLLMCSSMDRKHVLEMIGYLLLEGKPGGRRAAAKALADFDGPKATGLLIKALNDEDPEVRASLVTQLRPRKVPGALSLMIRMVDSPHEVLRRALREAMPEFTLRQFLANFDTLPEELQPVTGHLVRKIDDERKSVITAEIESRSPVRRRRAILAAAAMGIVSEIEKRVIEMLSDEDHMVRAAAAKVLADCKTMPTWEALRDALFDRSFIVKEAAEKSLDQISRFLLQPVEEAEEDAEEAEKQAEKEEPTEELAR